MLLRYFTKILQTIFFKIAFALSWILTYVKFKMNGVEFNSEFIARGVPILSISLTGKFSIGRNFVLHSGKYYNMIGRQQQCYFIVGKKGHLTIGENVGLSSTAIVCWNRIVIGNNVRIGGGTVIYDTDFHSINFSERITPKEDLSLVKTRPVVIGDGVFIGAHTIILKGVEIGSNSVVGAGSVVTRSIPANEIWAGNPAKFVKKAQPLDVAVI